MNRTLIILLFITFIYSQDRSTIFNTGSPSSTEGYLIDNTHAISDRIFINNNYVLEAMVFYVSLQSPTGSVIVSIREDNNGIPGQILSNLSTWNVQLDPLNASNYNLIVTTDLCIYLDSGNYYWWTIESANDSTIATWIYSNSNFYAYATTTDSGNNWTSNTGYAGAGAIWAEQIYENATLVGDINSDFLVNIIDVVNIIGYITGTAEFSDEQLDLADLNSDGTINIVDIVQLINIILTLNQENPDFVLQDINPASEYYSQNIGPSFFNGQVSCYYFGKQG